MWPEDEDAKHKGRDPATPHPDEARDADDVNRHRWTVEKSLGIDR
jgi:hypothetical protein